jgi:hypothetical protein
MKNLIFFKIVRYTQCHVSFLLLIPSLEQREEEIKHTYNSRVTPNGLKVMNADADVARVKMHREILIFLFSLLYPAIVVCEYEYGRDGT